MTSRNGIIWNMIPFSLFSFSYPQNLRKSLLNTPVTTTDERCDSLRSKCKEILLTKETKQIGQIKKLILNSKDNNYLEDGQSAAPYRGFRLGRGLEGINKNRCPCSYPDTAIISIVRTLDSRPLPYRSVRIEDSNKFSKKLLQIVQKTVRILDRITTHVVGMMLMTCHCSEG